MRKFLPKGNLHRVKKYKAWWRNPKDIIIGSWIYDEDYNIPKGFTCKANGYSISIMDVPPSGTNDYMMEWIIEQIKKQNFDYGVNI